MNHNSQHVPTFLFLFSNGEIPLYVHNNKRWLVNNLFKTTPTFPIMLPTSLPCISSLMVRVTLSPPSITLESIPVLWRYTWFHCMLFGHHCWTWSDRKFYFDNWELMHIMHLEHSKYFTYVHMIVNTFPVSLYIVAFKTDFHVCRHMTLHCPACNMEATWRTLIRKKNKNPRLNS